MPNKNELIFSISIYSTKKGFQKQNFRKNIVEIIYIEEEFEKSGGGVSSENRN